MFFLRLFVIVSMFGGVFAFGGGTSFSQELKIARISFPGSWECLPAIVAAERGYLAREGVYMSGVPVGSREAIVESLASGATDFAVLTQAALIQAAAVKAPIKAVAINDWGAAHLLVARSGSSLKSPKDLQGKTVGLVAGSDAPAILARLLDADETPINSVTLRYFTAGDLERAFSDGVDAVLAQQQLAQLLVDAKEGTTVLNAEQIAVRIGYIGAQPLVASPNILKADPALVVAVQRAWVASKRHIRDNPEDAALVLRIYMHRRGVTVSAEQARAWVSMQRYDLDKWDASALTDANYNAWALAATKLLPAVPTIDGSMILN
jgi:ABC-type nitrate/sulfonate/bicarbonate transport system substrate-binding protein